MSLRNNRISSENWGNASFKMLEKGKILWYKGEGNAYVYQS